MSEKLKEIMKENEVLREHISILLRQIASNEKKENTILSVMLSINEVKKDDKEIREIFKHFGIKFGENKRDGKYINFK